ncbi:hypothetical protein APHAL10511_002839 [Amanita phalloides]|nr:hypothetical protein APHAL10511_002839 [Amanita phalloides]
MTSLATQLAQNASLNSGLLVDRSRRKTRESYLFTGKEADSHDLDSLHALGINGLIQLSSLNTSLRTFEDSLFSDQARSTDRTLLSTELNEQLNKNIASFMPLLGPFLLESPTHKVLEWLVRRIRINEFNVEDVLALFLPYHETPHFAKMLSILHIKPNSTWGFLLPFKSAAQPVPRLPLVTEMLRNTDVARFITSLLPAALRKTRVHKVLLMFNAACLHDFITRSKALDEGTVAFLLPAILEPLGLTGHEFSKDTILGSYVLLAAFSQKCHLSAPAMRTIVSAMANAALHVQTGQFVTAIVAVCASQEQQGRFSEKASKAILRLPSIDIELRNSAKLVGFDKVMSPLLNGFVKHLRDDEVRSLMSYLLTCQDMPTKVLEQITRLALEHVISTGSLQTELRPILSSIHQRHPEILHLTSEGMCQVDPSFQSSLQALLVSLSLDIPSSSLNNNKGEKLDMVVASSSSEYNMRIIAVKELIGLLSSSDLLRTSELESIESALVSRVQDTNAQVLNVLYEKPSVIAPLMLKDAKKFVRDLAQCLCSLASKPKRNILKIHMTFLTKYICSQADQEVLAEVFYKLLFPFLLFSKPRQHTAEMVWDIIKENLPDSASNAYELLQGCLVLVAEEKAKNEENVLMMSQINLSIATKIARNVLTSNDYKAHFNSLVAMLRDDNPHIQVLTHLVMHALIKQLSGEHQIVAAHIIMENIDCEQFSSIQNLPEGIDELLQGLDGAELVKHTVVKPSSRSTLHWIQLAIIAAISTIPAPVPALDWTTDLNSTSTYVELMRSVYYIANASSSPVVSMSLLHVLFINLKDESLAFLAGIWSGADGKTDDDEQLRLIALHHASAFLQAHIDEDDGVDFQTIIPLLLISLSGRSGFVRQAALKCIPQLQTLAERKLVTVYKFDGIYGMTDRKLQYLDQNDLKRYLAALNEESDHLMHDSSFLRLFHERHLKRTKSDKRKEYEYKHRVLCYLLSHIQALSLPAAQVALLRLLENVFDEAKAQILFPLIKELVSADLPVLGGVQEDLISLCISSFDSSAAAELNDAQGSLWGLYMSTIRRFYVSEVPLRLRALLSMSMEKGLFAGLHQERKISLCELILEIGVQDHEMYGQCKKLLASLLTEVSLILHLLGQLQPAPADPGSRVRKRAKTTDDTDNTIRRLTLLAEVLGTRPLPGSLDLVSQLLDMSSRIMHSVSQAEADVAYIEQLLMSAIENAADKITQEPSASGRTIRLEILVELIRASDNPQTFHQALLLISKLSRLAPESVLHNVMPVFTFMGSNVFHRDDTYSFKVVQQTIESIVPVMVSSLKQSHANKLDLHIASRDFLRVFSDASNHIPRHRRNNFFSHLVDVLGPSDFLSLVCVLLVGKVAKGVVRQSAGEAQSTLALPISILQHNQPSVQISTLTEVLRESQRLTNLVVNPLISQPTVLDDLIDDESARATILKRRAKALIIFVGSAVTSTSKSVFQASSDEIGTFVSTLVSLASLPAGLDGDTNVDDIQQAAYSTMSSILTLMPATGFVSSALTMLESQEQSVRAGALDLLAERLPLVTDHIRQQVTLSVKSILHLVCKLVALPDEPIARSAFRVLRSIGSSLQSGEESVVTEAVPLMLAAIKQQTPSASEALSSLIPLSTKLGPRYIPYVRETVVICVAIISAGRDIMSQDAHAVLHGLLASIPAFWGTKEITQVVSTYTKHWAAAQCHGPSKAMRSLIKSITKRVPSRVLLPSLVENWPLYRDVPEKKEMAAYFDVVARMLRGAERPLIQEWLKRLSRMFLESFDAASATHAEARKEIILAFRQLVVKLDEASFKPLYRRTYDWAYVSEAGSLSEVRKKETFNCLYASLLDYFKALMTPYMSVLLQALIHDLKSFSKGKLQDKEYWVSMLDVVAKSLRHDDGGYWRDDKLRELSKPLVAQVAVCVARFSDHRPLVQDALNVLVETATDDALLKAINLDVLLHTRSEDVRLRVYALGCAELMWRNHGAKLVGFVAETATFIAECNEDENEAVVRASSSLKSTVESVAGSIRDL